MEKKQRIVYGVLVAISFVIFSYIIPQHDIILALATGNVIVPFLNKMSFDFRKKAEQKPSISEVVKIEKY